MEKKEVKKWQDEEALKRYRMIAPLPDPDLDEGKRQQMRGETAEKNGISKRALYRYEKGYREEGFEGLRPAGRSVRQIIKVLELEGGAQPGVLKPYTMQRGTVSRKSTR